MTNQNWMLFSAGAAIGAGIMFLLDPVGGGRRRALVRDQMVRATHKTGDGLDALGRDVYNRARGLASETWANLRRDDVGGRRLEERVRAELGRVVSHPRAIDVQATDDGCVCVRGPVLIEEADHAISAIQSVRGVCAVEDQLERHVDPENVPALQGGRTRPGRRSALMQDSWSPTTKALVCIASTALAAGIGYATLGPTHEEELEYTGA